MNDLETDLEKDLRNSMQTLLDSSFMSTVELEELEFKLCVLLNERDFTLGKLMFGEKKC